jgi:hypothetical protein
MRVFREWVHGIAAMISVAGISICGLACCDPMSPATDFDVKTSSLLIGRSAFQEAGSVRVIESLRMSFEWEDYEEGAFVLKERRRLRVDSVRVQGQKLAFVDVDSLTYGRNLASAGFAGGPTTYSVEVLGGKEAPSFREEVPILLDARITSPQAGDTVSMSAGFWMTWDGFQSQADLVRAGIAMREPPFLEVLTPVDQDGTAFVKEFDVGVMKAGPAVIVLTRSRQRQRTIEDGVVSVVRSESVTYLPIVLVE